MKHLKRILNLLAVRLPRLCCFALLLVLPFCYYPDYPDSSPFFVVARPIDGGMADALDLVNGFRDPRKGRGDGRTRLLPRRHHEKFQRFSRLHGSARTSACRFQVALK